MHKLKLKFETDFNITNFNLGSLHQDIINYTNQFYGEDYKKKLNNLRISRNKADYDLSSNLTASDARNVLLKVEKFISDLGL